MRTKNKLLFVTAVVTFSATLASAELVASLHPHPNDDVTDVQTAGGIRSRTNLGSSDADMRGTIEGEISVYAGREIGDGGYAGADFVSFASSSSIKQLNRYGGDNGGIVVWDFDVSGLTTNAWEFNVDYSTRRVDCLASEWYVSFNGFDRTLDTTVITNLAINLGGGDNVAGALVADPTKYVKIGDLPANTASGIFTWDLTDIVNAAATNGGGIRLVYFGNTYLETGPKLLNDSGLIATDSTSATPVVVPPITTLLEDDFETGSISVTNASQNLLNGWVSEGGEYKDYNTNRVDGVTLPMDATGMLVVQDVNIDEKGNNLNTEHSGSASFFENVFNTFEGIALTNEGDWLQLDMDVSVFTANAWTNSGAPAPYVKNSGEGLRIGLTDSTKNAGSADSGYGIYLGTGSNTGRTFREFKKAAAAQANVGSIGTYDAIEDGALEHVTFRLTRVGSDIEVSGSSGGVAFTSQSGTNANINGNTFDTLALSVAAFDHGLKIDNVRLLTSVEIITITPYEQWAIDSGLTNGIDGATDNPDTDVLDNNGEYIFGGDPLDENDIGTQPTFDAAGGYVYTLRNDDALVATILTRADLVAGDWTTNVAEVVTLDDGDLSSYTNAVGTGVDQQFYKLLVD